MWFIGVRVIFFGIIFVVIGILLKKSKLIHKKLLLVISLLTIVLLYILSGLFPIENIFIKFKTPQDVFNYSYIGKIEDVVYGENSCMIVYSKNSNTYSTAIIQKSSLGYKLETYFNHKTIYCKVIKDNIFEIYSLPNSTDYYITGLGVTTQSNLNITDSNNSKFKYIVKDIDDSNYKSIMSYAFVNNIKDDYFVLINGEKISIN